VKDGYIRLNSEGRVLRKKQYEPLTIGKEEKQLTNNPRKRMDSQQKGGVLYQRRQRGNQSRWRVAFIQRKLEAVGRGWLWGRASMGGREIKGRGETSSRRWEGR